MLNKVKKSINIRFFLKVGAFLAVFALFFVAKTGITYAQYYQAYNNGNISTYSDSNSQIDIQTSNVTNITSTGGTINGLVNGNNLYNTYNLETWFQYGTTTNLEKSSLHNSSNSGYATLSATLSGLSQNTVYYFRAVGQTPRGVIYGSINWFRTDYGTALTTPTTSSSTTTNNNSNVSHSSISAVTQAATDISDRSAELNSLILNPAEDPSTITWFEYGTNSNLGTSTTLVSVNTYTSASHTDKLDGLSSGTIYFFRAVVENSSGRKVNGAILSFTTSGTNQKITTSPVVSNSDTTNNSTINQGTLGANAYASGSIFPATLLGWLVLITFILLLVLLCQHFYNQKYAVPVSEETSEHLEG